MGKRYRKGKQWEQSVVWGVAFVAFAICYTWTQTRVGPDNLSIPLEWFAVGVSLAVGFWFGYVAYAVLEFRHRRSQFRRARRRW